MSRFALLILFANCFQIHCASPEKEDLTPNIVLIFTDDQGYQDVGCFGSPDILTPNLDKLANDGVLLTDFVVAQPVCSASRAALLTGCYPNRIGLWGALMPEDNRGLNQNEYTMAEMLKDRGYSTGIFGKWHLGNMGPFHPMEHGFDEYFGIPYSNDMWPNHPWQGKFFNFPPLPLYENRKIVDTLNSQENLTRHITFKVIDFIDRHKGESFFAYVPHPQPHVPLFVSDNFKGKSERGLYGDVIMEIDWSVGEIVKALDRNGLSENTIVIFTSDNGPWLAYGTHGGSALPFREGKGTTWEGGVREPFIMKYPKKIKGGQKIKTPMMSIDLMPTIAHLTGSTLSDNPIDGVNAWSVITEDKSTSPQDVYYYYYGKNELRGIRQGEWKLHFPHTYNSLSGGKGGDNGLPEMYDKIALSEMELYNLGNDQSELNNIISEYPEVVKSLLELADEARKDMGDDLTDVQGSGMRSAGIL